MQILIKISSLTKIIDIIIDTNKNLCLLGNKKVNINTSLFAGRLLAIISSWQKEMINNSIIDGESYTILIKENKKQIKYVGKNCFPSNYAMFKNLVNEVTDEAN